MNLGNDSYPEQVTLFKVSCDHCLFTNHIYENQDFLYKCDFILHDIFFTFNKNGYFYTHLHINN